MIPSKILMGHGSDPDEGGRFHCGDTVESPLFFILEGNEFYQRIGEFYPRLSHGGELKDTERTNDM